MEKIKIAVLISGGGTNLQALIDAQTAGTLVSGEIAAVISSSPDAYGLERARRAGIPAYVVDRKTAGSQEDFEAKLIERLTEAGAELIVLAGFLCLLSADFTGRYPERILNVHPSLIPAFCGKGFYGLKVHEAALSYGVKVTGATVHFVNEVPDGGRILCQKAVAIRRNDTPETLQKRVMKQAEWVILPRTTEKVARKLLAEKKGKERKHDKV